MSGAPHIPVLLRPLLEAVAPVSGVWLDGTFGAGGYSRGLLEAGAQKVIGVDRDPAVFAMAEAWRGAYGDRLELVEGMFSELDQYAGVPLDGIWPHSATTRSATRNETAEMVSAGLTPSAVGTAKPSAT